MRVLIICLLSIVHVLNAQRFAVSDVDRFDYYKVSETQLDSFFASVKKVDSDLFLMQGVLSGNFEKVDSGRQGKEPYSNYTNEYIVRSQVKLNGYSLKMLHDPFLKYTVDNMYGKAYLNVLEGDLEGFQVFIDGVEVTEEGKTHYQLLNKKGWYKFKWEEEVHYGFYEVNRDRLHFRNKKERIVKRKYKGNKKKFDLAGQQLLLLNKPKYRLGDTVQCAAYIGDYSGKDDSLMFVVRKQWHTRMFSRTVAMDSNGVFNLEFEVDDRFELDKEYHIETFCMSPRKSHHLENRFRVEDYLLDPVKYSLEVNTSKEYYNGDSVKIIAKAIDKLGLPEIGVQLYVEVKADNYSNGCGEDVIISKKIHYDTFYLEDQISNTFYLSDSLFPYASVYYSIKSTLVNARGESKMYEHRIDFNCDKEFIVLEDVMDSLRVKVYDGVKVIDKEINLYSGSYEPNAKSKIKTPISFAWKDIHSHQYVTLSGNDYYRRKSFNDYSSKIWLKELKSIDSLGFQLWNPRDLTLNIKIWNSNSDTLFRIKGFEGSLIKQFDKATNGKIYVRYSYTWLGRTYYETSVLKTNENVLSIESSIDAVQIPGEEVEVTVKVADGNGIAVSDANVIGLGVNNLFEKSNVQGIVARANTTEDELKHFDRVAYEKRSIGRKFWYKGADKRYNFRQLDGLPVTQDIQKEYGLDSILFYEFLLNDIDSKRVEVEGLGTNMGILFGMKERQFMIYRNVSLIKVDGVDYYKLNGITNRYCMPISDGEHFVEVFAGNRRYFKKVLIEKGKLNLFCIDNWESKRFKNITSNSEQYYTIRADRDYIVFDSVGAIPGYDSRSYMKEFGPMRDSTWISFVRNDSIITKRIFSNPEKVFDTETESYIDPSSIDLYWSNGGRSYRDRTMLDYREAPEYYYLKWLNKKKLNKKELRQDKGEGFSDLRIELAEKSNFKKRLVGPDSFVFEHPKYFNDLSYHSLSKGIYRLEFLKKNVVLSYIDSIVIEDSAKHYYYPQKEDYKVIFDSLTMSINEKQPTNGAFGILGTVKDSETEEPLMFASIRILQNGIMVKGVVTDFDGHFKAELLGSGYYDIEVTYVGYGNKLISGVFIDGSEFKSLNIEMNESSLEINEVALIAYNKPLVSLKRSESYSMEDLEDLPVMNVSASVASMEGSALFPSGARTDAGYTMIDGVRVTGSASLKEVKAMPVLKRVAGMSNKLGRVSYSPRIGEDVNEEIETTIAEGETNNAGIRLKSRTNFQDYAYWVPSLKTDSNGEAKYTITWPDNITTWNNYTYALNGEAQAGMKVSQTKAFKPLTAMLFAPRFLIEGDQYLTKGEVQYYNADTLMIKKGFNNQWSLDSVWIGEPKNYFSAYEVAEGTEQVVSFGAFTSAYGDKEERAIPVYKQGFEYAEGNFDLLKDTAFTVKGERGDHIVINSNALEEYLASIEELEDYPHWCVEQTASKLLGYVSKKEIYEKLDRKFKNNREIKLLSKKLQKARNTKRQWGWWPKSNYSDAWMTAYALKALLAVKENSNAISDLKNLKRELPYMTKNTNYLEVLDLMAEHTVEVDYESSIKRYKNERVLDLMDSLKIALIQTRIGDTIDVNPFVAQMKETALGGKYIGAETYIFKNNTVAATLALYDLLKLKGGFEKELKAMEQFFWESKRGKGYRNTFENAMIVQRLLASEKEVVETQVVVDGQRIDSFPYRYAFDRVNEKRIEIKGTQNVYYTNYTEAWNNGREEKADLYAVQTSFKRKGTVVEDLTDGASYTLQVDLEVKKQSDYVMLEIPIPAGCAYEHKKQDSKYRREYHKNKTYIYCSELKEGKHTFNIDLRARFSGNYTLNPVKVELMYFPTFYGNNTIRKVAITE